MLRACSMLVSCCEGSMVEPRLFRFLLLVSRFGEKKGAQEVQNMMKVMLCSSEKDEAFGEYACLYGVLLYTESRNESKALTGTQSQRISNAVVKMPTDIRRERVHETGLGEGCFMDRIRLAAQYCKYQKELLEIAITRGQRSSAAIELGLYWKTERRAFREMLYCTCHGIA